MQLLNDIGGLYCDLSARLRAIQIMHMQNAFAALFTPIYLSHFHYLLFFFYR